METSTTKQLFSKDDLKKLIIPLLFEQALAITVGMADTVMISSAGEAAVSGVSLIDMFNNLIISVLAALANRRCRGDLPVPRSREKRGRLQICKTVDRVIGMHYDRYIDFGHGVL